MAEAHAEHRDPAHGGAHQIDADAGAVWIARPGRQHDAVGIQRQRLIHRDGVVAPHLGLGAEFAKIMHQVVGEAVVIVD